MIIEGIYKNEDDYITMGWDKPFRIFLHIILFIVTLIHNEIIIINICGLGSETKYFLDLKLKSEELYTDTDDPDIMRKYETVDEMESISNN